MKTKARNGRETGMPIAPSLPAIPDVKASLESCTVDEIEEIEDALGAPIDKLYAPNAKKGPVIRAFVWVLMRRENPEATLADAGRVSMSALIAGDFSIPPTAAAG